MKFLVMIKTFKSVIKFLKFNGRNMSPDITQFYEYVWSLHMLCIDGSNTVNN